jgi:hypothetical protein
VTYCVSAPHPPSERRTDAGRLPPWLPGVAMSAGRCLLGVVNDETPICSAKDCRTPAVWVLAWNNPKLHTPERRKTWLACDEHREHLSSFLGMRGFLKDVVTLPEWQERESAADR